MAASTHMNLPTSVLVIEDDASINAYIIDALSGYDGMTVKGVVDGNVAWEEAKKTNFDFIVLDWKVPAVNGLVLFNRFRQEAAYQDVPILVISGFLNSKDFSLLEEFPLSTKLEKPFKPQMLLAKLSQLNDEAQWFKQKKAAITQLFSNPNAGQGDDYLKAILELEAKAPNPYKLCLAMGTALRAMGYFKEAEVMLTRAMKHNAKSIAAMSELAKLYLQTKRNAQAKKLLLKAMEHSPDNIDRICQLGAVSLQESDTQAAQQYFEKAAELDPENKVAESGLKLTRSIEEFLANKANPGQSYAAMLNAIGISMVRNKDFAEGIEHYQSAMNHVFDNETKARLSFNLGLGFKKWQRQDDAVSWFKKSLDLDPNFERALEQLHKIAGLSGGPAPKEAPEETKPAAAAPVVVSAPKPAPMPTELATQDGVEAAVVADPDVEEIYEGPLLDFPEDDDEDETLKPLEALRSKHSGESKFNSSAVKAGPIAESAPAVPAKASPAKVDAAAKKAADGPKVSNLQIAKISSPKEELRKAQADAIPKTKKAQ